MYFSPTSGSFYTSFIFDASISALTQVYMNPTIWYPNGYKWTMSKTKNGTALPATTVKKTEGGTDLAFSLFDTLIEDGRSLEILITPTLAALEGVIPATEEDLAIVYNYVDTGDSSKCPIKVHYAKHASDHSIQAALFDKTGATVKVFGKTIGSNGYDATCSELVDARIGLFKMSTSIFNESREIASLDLNGVNGHDISILIDKTVIL
jgi:hypothetical protein